MIGGVIYVDGPLSQDVIHMKEFLVSAPSHFLRPLLQSPLMIQLVNHLILAAPFCQSPKLIYPKLT